MTERSIRGPKISIATVGVAYGANQVLEEIHLEIAPGTIHAIIGPNGGGKSTLIKALLGEMRHTGTITLDWPEAPGTIGYVPQLIDIDKTLPVTVENFIALCTQSQPAFFGIPKEARATISHTLERLGLGGKESLLFSELSGGERQRVLFAQALIPAPDLLILDEPMNSLDRLGADIFATLLQELKAEGVTIVLIHHDLEQVERMSDAVTCINGGVLFSGVPKEVMDKEHLLKIFSVKPREKETN